MTELFVLHGLHAQRVLDELESPNNERRGEIAKEMRELAEGARFNLYPGLSCLLISDGFQVTLDVMVGRAYGPTPRNIRITFKKSVHQVHLEFDFFDDESAVCIWVFLTGLKEYLKAKRIERCER